MQGSSVQESGWPACSVEERPWRIDPRSMISHRKRQTIGDLYEAIVVPNIAEVESIPLERSVAAHAEDAAQEIARFDATYGPKVDPYGVILLRSESAASSRIELIDVSAKSVALAEIGEGGKQAAAVVANGRAMESAIDMADRLTPDAVVTMQTMLLEEIAPRHVGGFRNQQVWIGGSDLWPSPDAAMIAPHHTRVPASIEDLLAFVDRPDLVPVMAQVAVAHAQFETIHPFTDGNGRTGRALAHAMLRRKGVTRTVTVPISAGLLKNTQRYFDALAAYRRGDPNPIVAQFADATYLGITNATRLAVDIEAVRSDWDRRVKARWGSTARRVLELLVEQPAIDIGYTAAALDVSYEAVRLVIAPLEEAGVLVQSGGGQRYRRWVAPEILDALEAFAARSR